LKVSGQLERAQLENVTSDPSSGIAGRIVFNSTLDQARLDDGSNYRSLLRNDQHMLLGNSGTANDNSRLNRAAAGVIQLVVGSDTTAEGTLSNSLNQLSSRNENYLDAGKPTVGNAGRIIFVTDTLTLKYDTGAAWVELRSGTVAIANGGTGATTKAGAFDALSPMSAGGDLIYGGTSGTGTRLPNGTPAQVLTSQGGTAPPIWATPTASDFSSPTFRKFTSGSGTYNKSYTFNIVSGSATIGATYTNNAVTFTVYATVASSVKVVMSGSGAPASSGTLTKTSGTGDATLSFISVVSPLYLKVRLVGGGAGGAGGNPGATNGGAGGTTSFGTSLLTVTGGAASSPTNNSGAGGTANLLSPAVGQGWSGGQGQNGGTASTLAGQGASTPFGGGGSGGFGGSFPGSAAPANTGAGGGGGGSTGGANCGAGGSAGGYIEAIIYSPSATYAFAVGAGGTAGAGATAGGAGGSGLIIVEEYFQ
jgi:hypothetical protein